MTLYNEDTMLDIIFNIFRYTASHVFIYGYDKHTVYKFAFEAEVVHMLKHGIFLTGCIWQRGQKGPLPWINTALTEERWKQELDRFKKPDHDPWPAVIEMAQAIPYPAGQTLEDDLPYSRYWQNASYGDIINFRSIHTELTVQTGQN